MRFLMFLLGLTLLPGAARAEWRAAESTHFIVYSEGSDDDVREVATRLEKYDFLLRFVSRVTAKPSPVKVKVYMLRDEDAVQATLFSGGRGILGYYETGSRGPIAVMPRGRASEATLFHEYAHHFMFQYFPAAYPTWYTEGFAEYYGTARLLDNDVIEVGQPAQDRYSTFAMVDWLPVNKLLTARSYADVPGEQIFSLYAEGWLLVHYLGATAERGKQLAAYLNAINAGKSYEEAVETAFGAGARQLNADLRAYSRQRRLSVLQLRFKPIDVGPIRIRALGGGEGALIPYEIKLARGLYAREAKDFAQDVRSVARRFPEDPHALAIQAQAERAAGNDDAAMTLVDRWQALEPRSTEAVMWKARLEMAAMAKAGNTDGKAWEAVRQRLLAAHKASPGDPFILEAYYDSFALARAEAPAGAQNALYRAFELLPQSEDLRYKLARDFEQRGLIEDAIDIIKPSAFQLKDEEVEDARKKQKREQQEEKWRSAETPRRESAREMLVRLEAKLAARRPAAKGERSE
jgi:hypothetical protein